MDNRLYRLKNHIKHYEWGSAKLIPEFLSIENDDEVPYAEMWMGTHRLSPSQAEVDGRLADLTEISADLPFLFKLIAVESPLSIQAHPDKERAEEGFKREESQGLSIRNPTRNYKDANHKPEILCAISTFTLMAGFREPDGICISLEEFLLVAPQLKEIISPLLRALGSGSLSGFFRILSNFSRIEREYLSIFIREKEGSQDGIISPVQWKLMKDFAAQYPGDPAIISPLYLNIVTLQPGQAVFVPAGVLHAYLSGFGVELMAASDNVLRGGLTPKHVDTGELMNVLHFVPFIPQIITPASSAPRFCYHTPCSDFLLTLMRGAGDENVFAETKPAICLVTEGELRAGSETFKKGESFFVPQSDCSHLFGGNYSLFSASPGTT